MRKSAILALGVLLVVTGGAFAHHSFDSEFQWKKTVTVTGAVTKVEFMNPHSYLYIDAREAGFVPVYWKFELGSMTTLKDGGWKPDTLKAGDRVTVDAWIARNDNRFANAKSVKIPDGRELSGGSSILERRKVTSD